MEEFRHDMDEATKQAIMVNEKSVETGIPLK